MLKRKQPHLFSSPPYCWRFASMLKHNRLTILRGYHKALRMVTTGLHPAQAFAAENSHESIMAPDAPVLSPTSARRHERSGVMGISQVRSRSRLSAASSAGSDLEQSLKRVTAVNVLAQRWRCAYRGQVETGDGLETLRSHQKCDRPHKSCRPLASSSQSLDWGS